MVADPRISKVSNVKVSQKGPVVSVDATVEVAPASALLRLADVQVRLV
jgi:divalent metal cation (Fe/Co/Zn/Cd) transporter